MEGQGCRTTSRPPWLAARLAPDLLTMSGTMPGSGLVQLPGFVGVTPGSGLIMMLPVSVCHHVSTIGQRPWPITRWYHIQASGLIGSPTEPNSRKLDRSYLAGH